MRALADFLTRIPPPETNLMAKDTHDDAKGTKSTKSAFKIFARMRTKKEKAPGLVQLPDSAVSVSQTTSYIALVRLQQEFSIATSEPDL
jgi:hypothetical protein